MLYKKTLMNGHFNRNIFPPYLTNIYHIEIIFQQLHRLFSTHVSIIYT